MTFILLFSPSFILLNVILINLFYHFFLFLNDFLKYLFTLIVHVHDSYIIMH